MDFDAFADWKGANPAIDSLADCNGLDQVVPIFAVEYSVNTMSTTG